MVLLDEIKVKALLGVYPVLHEGGDSGDNREANLAMAQGIPVYSTKCNKVIEFPYWGVNPYRNISIRGVSDHSVINTAVWS